jgi:CRP-like cAMP-binding protein
MRLDDVIFILKGIPIFRRVESEALRLLAFSAERRQLRSGDVLFRRSEIGDAAFLILDGEIALDPGDAGAPSGYLFRSGSLIGQSALFASVERPATAVARGPTSVLIFTRALMTRVLEAHPGSAVIIRDALAEEARKLSASLQRLAV